MSDNQNNKIINPTVTEGEIYKGARVSTLPVPAPTPTPAPAPKKEG